MLSRLSWFPPPSLLTICSSCLSMFFTSIPWSPSPWILGCAAPPPPICAAPRAPSTSSSSSPSSSPSAITLATTPRESLCLLLGRVSLSATLLLTFGGALLAVRGLSIRLCTLSSSSAGSGCAAGGGGARLGSAAGGVDASCSGAGALRARSPRLLPGRSSAAGSPPPEAPPSSSWGLGLGRSCLGSGGGAASSFLGAGAGFGGEGAGAGAAAPAPVAALARPWRRAFVFSGSIPATIFCGLTVMGPVTPVTSPMTLFR
mmetsp:Transcript_522/g.1260  ORF Transcript_522/g.1260 Transcript_522/m.1260 type:complete len:259 (-) Transcript_522:247-1023(-)